MTHRNPKSPLTKSLLGLLGLALLPLLPAGVALAGPEGGYGGYTGGVTGIAERELIRRQDAIREGDEAVAEGDRLVAEEDYEGAIAEYRRALDLYPVAPIADSRREVAIQRYADASVELARQRADRGEYDSAKGILQGVLAVDVDPDHRHAQALLEDIDDPKIYNPANNPEHMQDVQQVESLLTLARGHYDLGNYDEARRTLNRVLVIDRYNTAAQRMLEEVERTVSYHFKSARDHTRIRMLREVDELWETYIPQEGMSADQLPSFSEGESNDLIAEKLRTIRIPQIQFDEATIQEAVDFLRLKSQELDFSNTPEKGVNILIKEDAGAGSIGGEDGAAGFGTPAASRRITLSLSDVPLGQALKYVTDLAGLRYRVEPFAVVVVPSTDSGLELYTRVFRVPPTFVSGGGGADAGADAAAVDPFATAEDTPESGLIVNRTAKDVLSSAGVTFPEGASAYFDKSSSRLIVRNTANNIDIVATYVENLQLTGQQQIFITTKFVEVSQTTTDEFGFDWLLGGFNVPGSDRTFGQGGTVGNAAAGEVSPVDFPFVPPGSDIPVGQSPVTRGLRFGTNAITADAIDDLIRADSFAGEIVSSSSPGIFAVAGVFTDPQFQVVIRALNQKKGVDLMSAPSIVTRSGQRAKIEVIREFIYPIEFDPPEIPQDFGSVISSGGAFDPFGGSNSSVASFPVTPTTPVAFETRNTGVTLEVDPVIGADGFTIDLNLAPEVVEFEGFINYGSPIQTGATNSLGLPTTIVLTENRIEQPVFSTRKVSTAVTIWDGQTVAIGGLIREDVQTVEDKVPVLGDIPFVGRLFRTKSDNHFKRNLMVFVTARIIDPAGQPIRNPQQESLPPTQGPTEAPQLFPEAPLFK